MHCKQGGQNNLLYGIPRRPDAPPPHAATNIYRLHYDGNSLSIEANVSHITGLGLGGQCWVQCQVSAVQGRPGQW